MAVETLKKLWKNEYFQTAITITLMFLIVLGFYFGAQAALGTEYPALAVASGSMLPTLNIGDLIIVQKIDPAQIHADPNGLTGDILVYKRDNELIVHRAVKIENRSGVYYITTRGDNTNTDDRAWPSTNLVGKVIARIPYVGNLPLFLHSERDMYILFLMLLIILIILMLPFGSREEEKQPEIEKPVDEQKFPTKIGLNLLFYILLNMIIVGLTVFSLLGSFTFWQPGAGTYRQGEWVTIYGMYADLQFHKDFVNEVYLSQSFLAYKIDCEMSGGTRLGVPTFAWYQFFLLIVIIFNVWKIFGYIKSVVNAKSKEIKSETMLF